MKYTPPPPPFSFIKKITYKKPQFLLPATSHYPDRMSNFGSKTPSGNSRLYNCLKCNKAFTRDEHLTRHILSTHNKLKPFVCGICERPFSRRDLLLRHAKNLHKGSEKSINRLRKSKKFMETNLNGENVLGTSMDTDDDSSGTSNNEPSGDDTPRTNPPSESKSVSETVNAVSVSDSHNEGDVTDKMSVKMLLT